MIVRHVVWNDVLCKNDWYVITISLAYFYH